MYSIAVVEMSISRAFAEVYDMPSVWIPEIEILKTAGCAKEKKQVIKAARKNLGIEKVKINGQIYWRWGSDESPDHLWEVKGNEINEGKGY